MPTEIATDYQLAERVALALAPLSPVAVLLGGVGDDWLCPPAYPFAVVTPSEAESARGQTTRTIRVRLAVRGADAASKPDPIPAGYGPWTFADGLLEAARSNLPTPEPSHLAIDEAGIIWLVEDGWMPGHQGHADDFANVTVAGATATMVDGVPWATAVVPPGKPVATREARTLLRVGAGPALDALVQAARDALSAADLGAPLESIATSYDPDPQFPVQSAELLLAFADPQAYGDAF